MYKTLEVNHLYDCKRKQLLKQFRQRIASKATEIYFLVLRIRRP